MSSKPRNTHLPLRLLLAFEDPAYERDFLAYYANFYFRYAQVSLGIGFVLILVDFFVDSLAFPHVKANYYRLTLVLPIMAALIGYTVLPFAKRHWQLIMAGAALVVGASLFWVLLAIDREGGMGLNSWVGMMNFTFVEFFCFVILGIRFGYALVAGTLLLLSFLYALWFIFGMQLWEVSYWSYHVVTLFLLTAGIGWWREFLVRQDFATRTALDEARRAAESMAQIKSEFLANMSHEIRTPLNGVLGLAQIGHRNSRARVAKNAFGRILQSGKLLLGIVNDILDFSKIEAGKLHIDNVPIALGRVLDEAVAPLLQRARAKSLALGIHKTPDLPAACLADPLRLTQILMNFLSNAVKFTEHGSIEVQAGRDGDTLVFRVVDTGIGMTAEQIERVFLPFAQADSSATRKFGGTGLGLTISRRLAQLMGGEIRVASRPGQGSSFELRLPYVAAAVADADLDAADDAEKRKGRRLSGLLVLAAEDNEVNQIILADLLAAEGAHVILADNGLAAVERVRQSGPDAFDIVLMDIQMREMDGNEATRRILELAPHLPVIGQTAHVMAEAREKSLAAGMLDHIAKPIDAEELVAKVLRHARRKPSAAVEAPVPPPTPEREREAAPVDWAALEAQHGDRPEFLAKLVASIVKTDGETPEKLRAAAAAGDMDEMTFLAHGTYNTALIAKADGLQKLAKKTENAARTGLPEAASLTLDLAVATEELMAHLSLRQGVLNMPISQEAN